MILYFNWSDWYVDLFVQPVVLKEYREPTAFDGAVLRAKVEHFKAIGQSSSPEALATLDRLTHYEAFVNPSSGSAILLKAVQKTDSPRNMFNPDFECAKCGMKLDKHDKARVYKKVKCPVCGQTWRGH